MVCLESIEFPRTGNQRSNLRTKEIHSRFREVPAINPANHITTSQKVPFQKNQFKPLFQAVGNLSQPSLEKKREKESSDLLALTEKLKLPIFLLQSLVSSIKLFKIEKEVRETIDDKCA